MQNKKILFATMPFEGHFNPLTGLAVYLQSLGYEVAWYAGATYSDKLRKLGITHYPYQRAREINQHTLEEEFSERKRIKGAIARLRFDLCNVFIEPAPDFVEDLREIRREWAFDTMIYDMAFTAGPFVKQLFNIPVVAVGVVPYAKTSKGLPPSGMGLEPSDNFFVKKMHSLLCYLTTQVLLKPCTDLFNKYLIQYGLEPTKEFVFDAAVEMPDLYLQSGVPGFEYTRSDMSENVRFVGPMLPYRGGSVKHFFNQANKTKEYKKVLLVTQGTVERNPEKIIIPTLEAYKKDPDTLVIVTTGGAQTAALRARYPQNHFIIEDFIDFHSVMPFINVYITNAGYGGAMLSIQHHVPMVAAGVHEGKNEIAARIGYFKLGINLKTETPKPAQIRKSVETILSDKQYQRNVQKLSSEFRQYATHELCEKYLRELLEKHTHQTATLQSAEVM